jgi:uncharacterized protein (UPF0335 family)
VSAPAIAEADLKALVARIERLESLLGVTGPA